MLSLRDKRILRLMEDTGLGLTINQAGLMFFPKKFAYDYARLRLKKLYDMKAIRRYVNNYTGELIYYTARKPSYHDNAVMNVYANFVSHGYKIEYFKNEKQWLDGSIRSDGFIVADNPMEKRIAIVEVDLHSVTDISKYELLYDTREVQKEYGVFPMVIILSDVERRYESENFEIVVLDVKCSDFSKVLQ